MAMDSIEQLLDIPIDHYVTINLDGMEDLINAVGGVEVNNKIDFTLDGVHVPVGKQVLDGKKGLAYSRMRHEDPKGISDVKHDSVKSLPKLLIKY